MREKAQKDFELVWQRSKDRKQGGNGLSSNGKERVQKSVKSKVVLWHMNEKGTLKTPKTLKGSSGTEHITDNVAGYSVDIEEMQIQGARRAGFPSSLRDLRSVTRTML